MPSIAHHQYTHCDEIWDALLKPWFLEQGAVAWRSAQPTAVLLPHASLVAFFKERLLRENIPAVGIHFLTPGSLRSMLAASLGPNKKAVAIREELQLLARLAAAELPDNPVAQAVAQEPAEFVKACDALDASGWGDRGLGQVDLKALARRYFKLLEECDLQSIYQLDRSLLQHVQKAKPQFKHLLVYGFTSQAWEQFYVLQAGLAAAEDILFCLPHRYTHRADEVWNNSWEEILGAAESVFSEHPETPWQKLVPCIEHFEAANTKSSNSLDTLISETTLEEADAIVTQTIRYLKHSATPRIGILFASRSSPLAREVSSRLSALGIHHHDVPGFNPGQSSPQKQFEAWCSFQEQPQLHCYLNFLESLMLGGVITEELYRKTERDLRQAFQNVMTDDWEVVLSEAQRSGSHLAGKDKKQDFESVCWPLLPSEATFAEFYQATEPALHALHWPERMDTLGQRAAGMAQALTQRISRGAFIEWLRALGNVPGRTRSDFGREPFAPVQLTTLAEATEQSWSHLILAGMNRGVWPPEGASSAFIDDDDYYALNQRGLTQGSQGEGQDIPRAGFSYLMAPHEQRKAFEGNTIQIFNTVSDTVSLSASLRNPEDAQGEYALSDLLLRIHYANKGVLPEASITPLGAALEDKSESLDSYNSVAHAYAERREETTAFSEYSFSLKRPFPRGLPFSCKAWEYALKQPAFAWYEHVLRVRPKRSPSEDEVRRLSTGVWLHDWMNPSSEAHAPFQPLPSVKEWKREVERKAVVLKKRITEAYRQNQRELPDWWSADWAATRRLAHEFAQQLGSLEGWHRAQGEWSLPGELSLDLASEKSFAARGRIDLLLLQSKQADDVELVDPIAQAQAAWIVDFKTGNDRELSGKGLLKGEGIQLALYALAVQSLGLDAVHASVFRPEGKLFPQLSADEMNEAKVIWMTLAEMNKTGRLGDRGPLRSAFTFCPPQPLATLAVDSDILERKWVLTHPVLES